MLRNFQYIVRKFSTHPMIITQIPGPKTLNTINKLNDKLDARTVSLVTDLDTSHGNFLVDIDGNKFLDMFCNIASLPLGYNNSKLLKAASSPEWGKHLIQRSALGIYPPSHWESNIDTLINIFSPPGMNFLHMGCGCGSGANENAYKATFIHYMKNKQSYTDEYTNEYINESAMMNSEPGSPDIAILSFNGGFHGRTMGCLSTTRSKPIHKINIPAFKWPATDFPILKYPLDQNIIYNKEEEERCVLLVKNVIKNNDIPIAGIIIEPIQSEGGDRHASPDFFRKIRNIAYEQNITFIVDEVQTGVCSSGKMWAHEHWNLDNPPDIVTFGKKMQIAGYFSTIKYRPDNLFQIYNTWMGDSLRILLTNEIGKIINEENLLERINDVGKYIMDQLYMLENKHKISNVRGIGTLCAFDVEDSKTFLTKMLNAGINVGVCGTNSIRLRPSLTLTLDEAKILIDILNKI
jgi:4-aminobutyrate aminotransferase/(S)-3-amino-2-methylpropionate transaminase